jgi:hypothetical protein
MSAFPPALVSETTRTAWGRVKAPAAALATLDRLRLPSFADPVEVATISVAPIEAAPVLLLDRVARRISAGLKTAVAATFMADHYCLGGYRLFERGRSVDALLLEEHYVDGPRLALERLTAASIALDRSEQLSFVERWFWEHVDGEGRTYALALRGEWLAQPRRMKVSEDEWTRLTACYVLDYPRRPEVARSLRNQAWRGHVRAWAEQQVREGCRVYLQEDGYAEVRPQRPPRKPHRR